MEAYLQQKVDEVLTVVPDVSEEEIDDAIKNWITDEKMYNQKLRVTFLTNFIKLRICEFIHDNKKVKLSGKICEPVKKCFYYVTLISNEHEDVQIYAVAEKSLRPRDHDKLAVQELFKQDEKLVLQLVEENKYRKFIDVSFELFESHKYSTSAISPCINTTPTFILTIKWKF